MSQGPEVESFRTRLRTGMTNFLQRYRGLLLGLVAAAIVITGALAIWTQIDGATKADFAARIEKSQNDYQSWLTTSDSTKKADLAKTLETELTRIEKEAPQGYGRSKAWFIHGTYWVTLKNWTEASKAFHAVFDQDKTSYLAPIGLVNAGVALEEAGDLAGALAVYGEFEKHFAQDGLLAPQVYFTQGRILEAMTKPADAVVEYKKLVEKYPESSWTKLGRDRIISLN